MTTTTAAMIAAPVAAAQSLFAPAEARRGELAAARVRERRFRNRAGTAYSLLGWLLAAAATVLAATGQIEFAISADITDARRFLVPAILEIAVIFVLLGGYLRACDGDTPALMWLLAAAITAFATWTNLEHGGPRAGRIFAAATVLTFILWLLKLRDRYRAARRAAGLLDAATVKFRLIRWIVMPRLTGRAWLVAVEYSLRDADEALCRARLWRDTYTDTRHGTAGGRWAVRRAARRAAELAVRAAHTPPLGVAEDAAAGQPQTIVRAGPAPTGAAPVEPAPATITPVELAPAIAPAGPVAAATTPAADNDLPEGVADSPEPDVYTPTSDEDAAMYEAWRRGVAAGREPSGAGLARAAGRSSDATGVGRRAARRYRDAHAVATPAAPQPSQALPASPKDAAATAVDPAAAVAAAPGHDDHADGPSRHNGHRPTLTGAAP